MAEKIINVDGVNTPKTNLGKQKMEIIVSAAVDLFTKEGFYQTSISDICKNTIWKNNICRSSIFQRTNNPF